MPRASFCIDCLRETYALIAEDGLTRTDVAWEVGKTNQGQRKLTPQGTHVGLTTREDRVSKPVYLAAQADMVYRGDSLCLRHCVERQVAEEADVPADVMEAFSRVPEMPTEPPGDPEKLTNAGRMPDYGPLLVGDGDGPPVEMPPWDLDSMEPLAVRNAAGARSMTGQFSESHLLPPATREDFEEYLSGVLGIPTPITTPSGLPVPDDFTDAAGQPWHVEAPGTLVRGRRPVTLDTTPGEVQARYDALVTPQEPQVAVSRQFLDRETGEPKDAADAQQGDLVITEWAPPPVQVDVLKARAGRTGQGKVYETPLRGADGVLRPDQRDTAGVTQPTDRRDPEPWRTDHRLVVGSTWRRQGCSRCDAIQREVESGDRHAQDHRAEHLREHEQKGT